MRGEIDPSARIDPSAILAANVTVGPFSWIGPEVVIGANTVIGAQVTIERWTTIGARCRIGHGAKLGGDPQHRGYDGSPSYLYIGDDCDIRELVVIHRSAFPQGATVLGHHVFVMAQAHVAHDCIIRDHGVVASLTALAGHVEVETSATIGGVSGIHQFVRVGSYSMVGGGSRVVQDVPPFMLAVGNPATVHGLNAVGLRRAAFPSEVRRELKQAYRLLYRSGLNVTQALVTIQRQLSDSAHIAHLIHFIEHSKRGLCS